ncbi:MAG: D-tyrosyl-tRNA(Tyr) deacylase [SAR202 cluster bacterium]|nr:D-tyrosyl-tRNA(Tyr) deacylase [SAR202 cluster bacterium]
MRALLQRVSRASVSIDSEVVGRIGPGFVVLLGIALEDTIEDARYIVEKTVNLRVFSDAEGKFNLSALDTKGELLVVSQFTLHADTRKGRRPSFLDAAPPEQAQPLFEQTLALFRASGLKVETGRFQAHMAVSIENDGPVTIMLNSSDLEHPRRS